MIKKFAVAIFLILLATYFAYGFTAPVKASVNSVFFLAQIAPEIKIKPLNWLSKKPLVEEVNIVSQNRTIKADIYKPRNILTRERQYPAAVLAYGTDVAKNKPELTNLASSLSRLGVVVLVPDIPELLQTRVVASEVEDFINVFSYLKTLPYVNSQKLGFVSFCIGSSLSLLASSDQRISPDVNFLVVKSVYVDTFAITRDTMTRTLSDAIVPNFWQPQEKLRYVVINEMTDFAADEGQKKLIRESLLDKKPLSQNQAASLAADSETIYNYLANADPAKSKELWDKIPEPAKMDKVSPIVTIGNLKAKVFIMAATSDIYLPYTESKKLYKLLPENQAYIKEVGFLDESGLNPMATRKELLQQGFKLYSYFYHLLLNIYN